jgi:hypothetical protein
MRLSDWKRTLLAVVGVAASLSVSVALRARLLEMARDVRRTHDSYYLPGPDMTVVMSLGYRAALADLVFAHVLVSYGLHFQEKRRFEAVTSYLDAIIALDPKYREAYRLADTFITLQPKPPRLEDYRNARRIEARGLAEFPYDQELWLIAGQYLAYIAANQVPAAERDEWRFDGAKKLARSCELIGSNQNIPHHCITAAALFNEAGKRDLVRGFLERVLAISDDQEIQSIASGYLGRVVNDAERERLDDRNRRFRALWGRDLTFVSREMFSLLGPQFDPARCAGLPRSAACATSLRAWGEALE